MVGVDLGGRGATTSKNGQKSCCKGARRLEELWADLVGTGGARDHCPKTPKDVIPGMRERETPKVALCFAYMQCITALQLQRIQAWTDCPRSQKGPTMHLIRPLLTSISDWLHGYPDCITAFFCFSFFLVFSYHYFLPFKFFCLRSLISPIAVCFFIFIFYFFLVPFKHF